jgi:hypothetical protein
MRVGPQWADEHIATLRRGESATFRPRGRSMEPLVMDNQEVTVEPYGYGWTMGAAREPEIGDIVLVTIDGRQYLHKILNMRVRIGKHDGEMLYEIGNNRGGINGWVTREAIHGLKR